MTGPMLLGIDGGGTSTLAWLANAGGTVLGTGSAGPSNAKAVGPEPARRALSDAIAGAFASAGRSPETVAVACFGLAGFDRPEDHELLTRWSNAERWADRLVLVNDGDLVLAAGTPQNAGIALIAGTGSIAIGRSPEGRVTRAGGWGHLIGDEGSAYGVALAGLRLVARRADGRDDRPPTDRLTNRLCEAIGVETPGQIVSVLYGPGWDRMRIASLAPLVVEASESDPIVWETILSPAAIDLAAMVEAVRRNLGWDPDSPLGPPPLAITGGFLLSAGRIREALERELDGRISQIHPVSDPVAGAIILARGALG